MWNLKGPQRAKTIMRKKNKAKGFPLPYFKTYYKVIVTKTDTGIQTYIQSNETEQRAQKLFWRTQLNSLQQGGQDYTMGK